MKKMIYIFVICSLYILLGYHMSSKERTINSSSIIIGLAGDTMLGRLVNNAIDQFGYIYPWGNIIPLLKSTNLNLINLETTLTNSTDKVPKVFNFKATPDKVQTLIDGHISIVSLANNHSKDFGNTGLLETVQTLDHAHILHVGAGKDAPAARKPVVLTKQGITIGILGATDNEPDWQAGPNTPGVFYIAVKQPAALLKAIKNLRPQVDILIVSLHWGPNMREHPTQEYINTAHAIIDAGADIIHGHSAHIFQGIEVYNKKIILYDTGDFVDDYAVTPELRNDHSFFFKIKLTKQGPASIELIPLLISNMQVNHAPPEDAQQALARMAMLCKEFGTSLSADNTITIESA